MYRFMRAAVGAALVAGGLGSAGCAAQTGITAGDRYRNAVDTTWPDHYNYAARQAVVAPFAQQVANGHFLEQTIWNWYFEPGTDKLTLGGTEKLDSIARSTPSPDPKLYIQTARDLRVVPEKLVADRDDLNARRANAVLKYMSTQPGTPVAYEVYVHDAPVPSIYSVFAADAWRGQRIGYVGGLTGGGAAVTGTSGVTGSNTGGVGPRGGAGTGPGAGTGTGTTAPSGTSGGY